MKDCLQIQPNHADHISYYKEDYLQKMFKHEHCIAQPKYDGERMLIHIDHGNVWCTSRRFSKKTGRFMENQDKLPALQEVIKEKCQDMEYTVLDCECYNKDWSTIVGILHSLPDRAVELQKENPAKFAAFDCLFFKGEDIRDACYEDRLYAMFDVVKTIDYDNLHIVEFMLENGRPGSLDDGIPIIVESGMTESLMSSAISSGFEGIVVKSLNRKYYDKAASLKCKKFETVDVVVCGYQQGRGKYSDTIGALEIGYFDKEKNEFVTISRVNCSTDAERNYWRDHWDELVHSVIEVKCQEITARSLRHPVYIRRRDDKSYEMCTRETIFTDKE